MRTRATISNRLVTTLASIAIVVGACNGTTQTTDVPIADAADAGAERDVVTTDDTQIVDATDASSDATSAARPLGTVTADPAAPCPTALNAPAGAMCRRVTVRCDGIEDLAATIAITEPASPATRTVVMHNWWGGTDFFDSGFVAALGTRSFRVVQVAWDAPGWPIANAHSARIAACRPATLFRWVHDNVHEGGDANGYCLLGMGGGSSAVAYAFAHYGLSSIVDYAALVSGPPYARIDYGCAPATYTGPDIQLCPGTTPAHDYSAAQGAFFNQIEGTTTCGPGVGAPSEMDLRHWQEDSIVSSGANYDYGTAQLGFWFCGPAGTGASGLGSFYLHEAISPMPRVHCVADMCSGETPWPGAFGMMVDEFDTACAPH